MKATRLESLRLTLDGRPVRLQVVSADSSAGSASTLRLPLLLLHGLACSSDVWGPSLRCLERQQLAHPVFTPDLPGYGKSPGPPEALGVDELADWSARLLDALQVERVHVAGNSMGCQVALALARRHPDRIGSLVLIGPTPGGHNTTLTQYFLGLLVDGCREAVLFTILLLWTFHQMGFRRYMATVTKMMADNPVAHAPAVSAPTLVLRGDRDPIVSERAALELTEQLPRGTYQTIPGAAHGVQFTRPEQFTRVALTFLSQAVGAELPHSGG